MRRSQSCRSSLHRLSKDDISYFEYEHISNITHSDIFNLNDPKIIIPKNEIYSIQFSDLKERKSLPKRILHRSRIKPKIGPQTEINLENSSFKISSFRKLSLNLIKPISKRNKRLSLDLNSSPLEILSHKFPKLSQDVLEALLENFDNNADPVTSWLKIRGW